MNWDNSEREIQQDFRHGSQLRTAILVSLVLHGMILAVFLWLMDQRAQNRQPLAPVSVRINLLPPPVVPEQRDLPVESGPPEGIPQPSGEQQAISEVAENIVPEPMEQPVNRSALTETLVDLPLLAESPLVPSEAETVAEPVRSPDALTVRQTVRTMRDRQNTEAVPSSCTLIQRRNELLDCPELDQPDYTTALRNPVYLSFNQPLADDRSRRAMGTITGNQQQLRSGIQGFSLKGVDNDYLLEELSQGIEVYSGTGNTPLLRLTDQMYRNNPAYQQAKRVMNPR